MLAAVVSPYTNAVHRQTHRDVNFKSVVFVFVYSSTWWITTFFRTKKGWKST